MTRRLVTEFALVLPVAPVACVKYGPPHLALGEGDPAGYIPCIQRQDLSHFHVGDSRQGKLARA
jgi:hypothetical protein